MSMAEIAPGKGRFLPFAFSGKEARKVLEDVLRDYIIRRDLGRQIHRTERTLAHWEALKKGPAVTRIGKTAYYSKAAIQKWLRSREARH